VVPNLDIYKILIILATLIRFLAGVGFLLNNNIKQNTDFFSPLRYFLYYDILSSTIFLFLGIDPYAFIGNISQNRFITDHIATLSKTLILINGSFIFQIVGLLIKPNKMLLSFFLTQDLKNFDKKMKNFSPLVLFFIGFILWYFYMQNIGGFLFYLRNIAHRTQLTAGMNYLMFLWRMFFYVAAMSSLFCLRKGILRSKYFAYSLIVISLLFMLSIGGRRAFVNAIIHLLIIDHYYRKAFNFKIRHALYCFIAIFLLLAFGFWRSNQAERFSSFDLLEQMRNRGIQMVLLYAADISRPMLIVGYVEKKGFWLGSSYVDLLTSPIPRSILPSKAVVDDGQYIYSLSKEHDVKPSLSPDNLHGSSLPAGNWMGYINWGIFGYFIFSLWSGMIAKAAYVAFKKSEKNFSLLLCYLIVIKGFAFNNLFIVHFIVSLLYIKISLHILLFVSGFFRCKHKCYPE